MARRILLLLLLLMVCNFHIGRTSKKRLKLTLLKSIWICSRITVAGMVREGTSSNNFRCRNTRTNNVIIDHRRVRKRVAVVVVVVEIVDTVGVDVDTRGRDQDCFCI